MSDLFVQYEYAKSNGQVTNNIAFAPNYKGSDWADSGLGACIYLKFSVDSAPSTATNIWWGSFVLPIDAANDDFVKYVAGVRVKNNNGRAKATLRISKGANTGATVDINFDYGKIVEIALYPSGGRYYVRVNGGQVSYDAFSGFGANYRVLPLYSLLGVSEEWDYSTHAPVLGDGTVSNATYNLYNIKLFNQDTMSIEVADDADVFLDVVPGRMYQTNTTAFKDLVSGNVFETTEFEAFSPVSSGANYPQAQVNNIYIGSTTNPTFLFTNDQLTNVIANLSIDAIGNELTIDTLEFEVFHDDADETLRGLTYATPIWLYHGSDLVGKFYFKTIERIGRIKYKINAVSLIGLLEYEKHYGGYYAGKNVKEAVENVLLSDGLRRYIGYEYADWYAQSSPVDFGTDFAGPNATKSGTQTAVFVDFSIVSVSNIHVIWYNNIDDYGGATGRFSYGVDTTRISSDSYYVNIYCSFKTDYSQPMAGQFPVYAGDRVQVAIYPYLGRCDYSVNLGARTGSITFTPISVNYKMPIFASIGTSYYASRFQLHVANSDYHLYELKLGSRDGSWSDTYLDIVAAKDTSDDSELFYDLVSGNSFPMWHDVNPYWYYNVGGNKVGRDSPAFYQQATFSGEMATLANNIVWQSGVDTLLFSGWIPSGSKREVLHQILFALNLNMYKSGDGNLIIGRLPSAVDGVISDDDIYVSGSVEYIKKPLTIELTEHYYNQPSGSAIEIFNNTGATVTEESYVAEFNDAPVYGTPTSSGLTIITYNANAAVVSGVGIIYGKPYAHSKRVISETVDTRPDGDTVSVSDATLVTFLNSGNVMDKLKAYYANNAYKIKNAIIGKDRKVGRKYTLTTPFYDEADAYLTSINASMSGIGKFDCEFLGGYTPVDSGSIYNSVVLLTGSGSWVVPDGVDQIHVVIIGGGNGGDSGFAGADGSSMSGWSSTSPAEGGNYGSNGLGGKILIVDINNPAAYYSYSCGSGGSGGSPSTSHDNNNVGQSGEATTFGSLSSANGESDVNGYTDILSGRVYGASMPTWDDESGKGGDGGYVTITGTVSGSPTKSQVKTYDGEKAYNKITGLYHIGGYGGPATILYSGNTVTEIWGSNGGGAIDDASGEASGGILDGNDGANATYVPPNPLDYNSFFYGYGGMGGCGGGGGGSSGYFPDSIYGDAEPGLGGYGGRGGNGAPGCILVYY